MGSSNSKNEQIERLLAQLHGSSTHPTVCRSPAHCLRRFERSDCGCKGVPLFLLRVLARKPPHCFTVKVLIARHILPDMCHGAPAARLDAKGMCSFAL